MDRVRTVVGIGSGCLLHESSQVVAASHNHANRAVLGQTIHRLRHAMSNPSAAIKRLQAQILSKGFLAYEIVRGYLAPGKRLKILFSARDGWMDALAKKSRFTRHEVTFGDIQHAPLDHYDLVVPLDMDDVRFLSARRSGMRNLIPVPSPQAIDLCDDKSRFHEYLSSRGFGHRLPKIGTALACPYVLKKRVDEAGAHCHIVTSPAEERAVATQRLEPGYFMEEYIPGRQVHASHILFMGGRIIYAFNMNYGYDTDFPINSKTEPAWMGIGRCPWTRLFTDMLTSIGYEGLCCVDYKMHNGEPVVLEINPRLGRSATGYFFAFLNHLSKA